MPGKPITYRDLRNTPGRVFERLAEGRALLALGRLQGAARRDGTAALPLAAIAREVRAVRRGRRGRESG